MRRRLALCSWCLVTCATLAAAQLAVGMFSTLEAGVAPEGWEPLRFSSVDQETEYLLVALNDDEGVVLQADSRASASALITEVTVDAAQHPYLHWAWKTDDSCVSGSWRHPDTDDFPLRLFVIFERSGGFLSFFKRLGPGFPGDAILYVADVTGEGDGDQGDSGDGDDRSSHVSGRIKVVPVEHPARAWGRPVRDVRADYVELFGREPPAVAAVAVMTDSDNSRSECVSYFGDIYFSAGAD